MKKINSFIKVLLMAVLIVSCDKDIEQGGGNHNVAGSSDNEENVEQLVSRYVMFSKSYNRSLYMYNISITTNLSSAYPGHSIVYGVECGYGDYAYYKTKSGNNLVEFNVPLFTDYSNLLSNEPWGFSKSDVWPSGRYPDEGNSTNALFYTKPYYALKERLDAGETLRPDEQDLYNYIVQLLNYWEPKLQQRFLIRGYAEVDGVKYYL